MGIPNQKPMVKVQKPAEAPVHDSNKVLPMPPFTIKELRDAIPAHCFERSLLKSSFFLARDLALVAIIAYAATFIGAAPLWARYVLWPVYWIVQGTVATGIWVIAHECGHQAFSPSKAINNAVGLVLHSALLVPYHSWRISHAKHHAATGHMTRDQVFVPKTASQLGIQKPEGGWEAFAAKADDILEDSP